jgi:hypothetical protein
VELKAFEDSNLEYKFDEGAITARPRMAGGERARRSGLAGDQAAN